MRKYLFLFMTVLCTAGTLAQTLTVAQALSEASTLQPGEPTAQTRTVEGYVTAITDNSFNTTYHNMTFWISDTDNGANTNAAGALLVYRAKPDVELAEGNKVRVTAKLYNYNGLLETYSGGTATYLDDEGGEYVSENLRVCAQNLENYYYNYTESSRPSYSDEAGFRAKTVKIVNAMLTINADIYAFCEVEAKPIVLAQLADSMNAHAGVVGRYAAVSDGIDYTSDGYDNHLKSGFIYRTDRVSPYGNNSQASSYQYYRNTMRIQAFEQLSNHERLVLSMNHFKAKDSSNDQGESTRITNATHLLNALNKVTTDPDILVLGDLNCEYGETPISMLVNAGYEEQLLEYDANAYSHCYNGGELIDHVLANSAMAAQVTNAFVKHVCTWKCSSGASSYTSYSDHDPYIVDIMLNSHDSTAVPSVAEEAQPAQRIIEGGQLFLLLPDGSRYNVLGIRVR